MSLRRHLWLAVLVLLLPACGFFFSEDEVARSSSPGGGAVAILTESNAGATTSFGYDVYLAEPGSGWRHSTKVAWLYGAVRNEHAYGVNLRWATPRSLVIEYLRAHKANVLTPEVEVNASSYAIQLRAGISDPSAPPGGMLYNLQGRPHDAG